jgi:hypothetical protein
MKEAPALHECYTEPQSIVETSMLKGRSKWPQRDSKFLTAVLADPAHYCNVRYYKGFPLARSSPILPKTARF